MTFFDAGEPLAADTKEPPLRDTPSCRCCGSVRTEIFHRAGKVPANSCLLIPSREEALAFPRGEVALAFCRECGFIFNAAFERELTEYSARYEETQGFSLVFRDFQEALAADLVKRHGLYGRTVVEIGCGKGEFLTLLCELGGNRGIGFDPAYIGERNLSEAAGRVEVVRDFYSEWYADRQGDFICCKMTLEHIEDPHTFLAILRRSIGSRAGTTVFFLVPDAARIFRSCAFEDIYYEHCSYFTSGSLARLFTAAGFEVRRLETVYNGQYLALEAVAAEISGTNPAVDTLPAWLADMEAFRKIFPQKIRQWQERLFELAAAGRQAILWGSGSKGVAFLTAVGTTAISCVVDINPHRQGFYMAGSGVPIVSPETLREVRPDVVIVMNPVYREEIAIDLERLGQTAELWTV